MRVLLVGRTKWFSNEAGIHRALRRAGHEVAFVDDRRLRQILGRSLANRWLRARARAFRPDRILVFKPFDVEVEVLADLCERTPATMWYRDLRIPPEARVVERARLVDVLFLTPGGQAAEYEERGARRALWLPDAADPETEGPQPARPELACDVAFIGRGYDPYRAELLCRLAERWRVRVWGTDWEPWADRLEWDGTSVYGPDLAAVCASAAIVLGIDPEFQAEAGVWGYHSNRTFKVLAAGGFYLAHASPGMRTLLRDGEHCAFYDDHEDALAQVERWLSDPEGRRRVREAGRAYFLAHHTFDHRLPHLLSGEPYGSPLTGRPVFPPGYRGRARVDENGDRAAVEGGRSVIDSESR